MAQFTYEGNPNGKITAYAEGDVCVDSQTPEIWYARGPGLFSWAVAAGSGATGTPGACGISGVQGASGVSGVSGVQGISGVQGACGISGI